MPPKKKALLAPTPEPTWSREVPLSYTSFKVPPHINAKSGWSAISLAKAVTV